MKNNYTVIRARKGVPLSEAIWNAFEYHTQIGDAYKAGMVDVDRSGDDVMTITIPTKLLKSAINDPNDASVAVALKDYNAHLADVATPSFRFSGMVRGGARRAKSMTGREYVNLVQKGQGTTYFRDDDEDMKTGGAFGRAVRWVAPKVQPALVAGTLGGIVWLGVKTAKVAVHNAEEEHRHTMDMLNSEAGLQREVERRSGMPTHQELLDKQKAEADTHKDKGHQF